MSNDILEFAQDFFSKLHVQIESLEILKNDNNVYTIHLQSDDSSILIWPHWANIEALQRIITMLYASKNDEKIKIRLEINDYLQAKEQKLYSYIDSRISSLSGEWDSYLLPKYSSYERKKVHSYIAKNYPNIQSKSSWEWIERRMKLIKTTTNAKLTIDIDWDTI